MGQAHNSGGGQRLRLSSLSHMRDRRLRRILDLAGYQTSIGPPRSGDAIAAWGAGATAARAARWAARQGVGLLHLEDPFLRSLRPGRAGDAPLGLLIDRTAQHYDARRPSDLEEILSSHPLDAPDLLTRAAAALDWQRRADLSKYNAHLPAPPGPEGHVLVIDQTEGDAAIRLGGADAARFQEMLQAARQEHPGRPILIKQHPETQAGHRSGHFAPGDLAGGERLIIEAVSPWSLLAGAHAVYTVTSQMGFEAILAGHRPQVFGQPFYAGWGLSDDRAPLDRRGRALTATQLYAAAMLLYPVWYDPFRDRLGSLESTLAALEARARAWREDHRGAEALGVRLWKCASVRRFYRDGPMRFTDDPDRALSRARAAGRPVVPWGEAAGPGAEILAEPARAAGVQIERLEDGFLRSRGLGAALVPPLSLVRDGRGIFYDPQGPSDLEDLIRAAAALSPEQLDRARRLRQRLIETRLSKYNLVLPKAPVGQDDRIVLVVGQVEDDASILRGTAGAVHRNGPLLAAARAARPEARIVYKPHPDVEAGLRAGAIPAREADLVATSSDPIALVEAASEVWTLTSQMGFDALLRGVPVVCAGRPFYAGWGLTEDLPCPLDAEIGDRRGGVRPNLDALVQAALIDYPRYFDPVTQAPCPVEVAVARLAEGRPMPRSTALKLLAKGQGVLARLGLWR